MAQKLKEQINRMPRRASAPATHTRPPQPASPHNAGHYAGLHAEDAPYTTQERSRRQSHPTVFRNEAGQVIELDDRSEDDDAVYAPPPTRSAIRYTRPQQEVYTQGNRKIVVHREPPPKRRIHWMLFVGIAMFVMLSGTIEVVEINTQVPKDDHIYAITTASDSSTPVSIRFQDVNHDGKIDMLVTIGDSNPYTVVMLNNGSVFQH
jgi:hypothetical protein